jgi:hypothetical protein
MRRSFPPQTLIHLPEELTMASITSIRDPIERSHRVDDGPLRDYRQRVADEQFERAERKRMDVAEQRSLLNDAKARIRAWEKVHELRLPASPTHPVLQVIAAATDLALLDVLNEQRQRSLPRGVA